MNIQDLQLWGLAMTLTTPRILVAFMVIPVFSQPLFPAMIRNGVMVVMTLALLPLTREQLNGMNLELPNMMLLIIKEGIIGLILGYAMSVPFWAARGAGFLLDMQRGATSALFYSPAASGMVSPLGNLLSQLALTLLFTTGGFMILLETLMLSYQVWPLHQFFPTLSPGSASFFMRQLDLLLYTSVLIAGPFIGIMLIIDFGMGMVGRYMPQLNIFTAAMPVKSALVFFILIFYIGIIGKYLQESFLSFATNLKLLESLFNVGQR